MPLVISKPVPLIDTVPVASSSLATVAYDHQRAILQVEFHDGTAYLYVGVPLQNYQDLLRAKSKGGYFNRFIRSIYHHTLLRTAASVAFG